MLKKIIIGALIGIISISTLACGSNTSSQEVQSEQNTQSEEVKTLQRKIDKALESEPSYDDLIKIQESYDELLNAEQEQIINYNKIEEMLTLSEETVSCVYTANILKARLKNPSSLNIISASCARQDTSMYVKIEYTASNDWGGEIENEYYCITDIPVEDKEGNWSCGLDISIKSEYTLELMDALIGKSTNRVSNSAQKKYERYSDSAVNVDANQIMDNLDLLIYESES